MVSNGMECPDMTNMADWKITATTIYCDDVDDEVTVLVYKDWSVNCTGYKKYAETNSEAAKLLKKSKRLKKQLKCIGPECHRVLRYKEKLISEEAVNSI